MSFRKIVRACVPFSVRAAVVRSRESRRFEAEHREFSLSKAEPTDFPFVLAEHRSPLRRPGTTYAENLQLGKEKNVALVAELIDRSFLNPGQVFSYHHTVGPPTRARGFVMGAELHDDKLSGGIGGGACQVSNLLYVLALLAGAEIVERHRHGFDLFPDSERTVPFGCGATVFFPSKDLRFRNSLEIPILIRTYIEAGHLVGQAFTTSVLQSKFELFEMEGSIRKEGDKWIRRNKVGRRNLGSGTLEIVAENVAVCLYDPEDSR